MSLGNKGIHNYTDASELSPASEAWGAAPAMSDGRRGYRSYLLRLWQAHVDGELVWRASLESPHSRERRGFVNLVDLFTFLEGEVGGAVQGQAALDVDGQGGDDHR